MIKTKTMNIYTIHKNNIQKWSINSKRCTNAFCRALDRDVFHSEVQICVYDQMNRVQEGQCMDPVGSMDPQGCRKHSSTSCTRNTNIAHRK